MLRVRIWRSTPRSCGGPEPPGQRVVLRVLVVAHEQMVAERTGAINALTVLLRTIYLGVDARKAPSRSQFKVIAG